ncbi:MAG: glycosyltransferase family 4 protein [Lachnospiraceae bacterium]|nr:glycosyltransferase family 4 protein [Lachnospiraceae bacterium]
MRIAMMTNNYRPVVGGVPIAIDRLAEGLRERGNEVYIFAPEYEGYQEEDPFVIRYRAFHKKAGGYVPLMKPVDLQMEQRFRELEFDIIHVHHPVLIGQRAQYLGKKYHVPVVFTYHTQYEQYLHYWKPYKRLKEREGRLERKLVDFIERQLVLGTIRRFTEKCSLVFAPTNQVKTLIGDRGWEANLTVMPTGLPESAYKKCRDQEEIRKIYGRGKSYLMCTVARLSAEKNLVFLLGALAELKKKIGDDFQMLVLGDGPQKQELLALTEQLGLSENVAFLGTVSNESVYDFHSACDLFLFASKSETQGIVLLEAMASYRPVVAVNATGVCDVVRDGQNGYMVEESEEVFAETVQKVLQNRKLYEVLSEGARETAERYRSTAVAGAAERNYQKILLTEKESRKRRFLEV